MDTLGIIGAGIGLAAALGGVFAAVWATGAFEYLGGKKKPGGSPVSRETLLKQILNLNNPEAAYQIAPSEKSDLEINWKIVDAKWLGIFAKESIRKTYRAYMVLDEPRHTVRYWEAIDNVEWVAGAPKVHYQNEFFRGKIIFQKSYGVQYGVKEDKTWGKVYEYGFDINNIRGPIRDKALENGWEFVEVLRRRNARKSSVVGAGVIS
jgi:hypothetical protein